MLRITDVVKHLLIINVLVFIGTYFLGGVTTDDMNVVLDLGRLRFAVFYPESPFFKPYQIVTYMFMHADETHLLFNMLGLFFFGPIMEYYWGPKKFLFYYLMTGFGALVLFMFVKYLELNFMGMPIQEKILVMNTPMLGASGAIFGLLAGFAMHFPDREVRLIFPPIGMKAKYMVLIYGALELFLGLGPFQTGIAHFAHLGGAISGILLILYWRKFGSRFDA